MATLSQILSHYADISGREWNMRGEDYATLEFLDGGPKPALVDIMSHEAQVDLILSDERAARDRFSTLIELRGMRGLDQALREAKGGNNTKLAIIAAEY